MTRFTPRSASEWGAVLPVWVGILGLTACFIVWAVTPDHIFNPLFVTTFASLMAVGAGARALETLRTPPAPPVPPLDPPAPAVEGVDPDAEGH